MHHETNQNGSSQSGISDHRWVYETNDAVAEYIPVFSPVPVPQKTITSHSIIDQYSTFNILRTIHTSGGCVRGNGEELGPCRTFPTYRTFLVTSPTPTPMSTDQRASERVGQLIHHAFESLLQANTDLERLQDLLGLGMDLKQLLVPHSQMTWKFMAPQEERFRENWKKLVSAMEGVVSSSSLPQPVVVENVLPASSSLPAITVREAEEAAPTTQIKV